MPDSDINELMSSLAGQAQREKERILTDTRTAVEETLKRARAEAIALEKDAERELERDLEAEKDRILGNLHTEAGNRRLIAKRAALKKTFQRAREKISDLCGSAQYPDLLKRLIHEALSALGEGGELVVAKADGELCASLAVQLGLSGGVRGEGDEPGTVVAFSPDGARRVDNSLRTRLDRATVVLEPEVSRILFDDSLGEEGPVIP